MTDDEVRAVFEKFTGNVKAYLPLIFGKSDREMMEPYIGSGYPEFSEADVERLCQPHPVQPKTEEDWDALVTVAFGLVSLNDAAYFAQSMEGDYMCWDIHLAEKALRRQPLTDNDWMLVQGARIMLENGDWNDADQEEVGKQVGEALNRLPAPQPLNNTVFDIVLC